MELNFEAFFRKYNQALFYFVYRRVESKEVAEDISAETFYKLYLNWENVNKENEKGLLAWIYKTARNLSIDYFRKEKNKTSTDIEILKDDNYEDLIVEVERKEDLVKINKALLKLSSQTREVLELRFKEDMKIKDIAELVGKNEGAVKMILYRGLDELKGYI